MGHKISPNIYCEIVVLVIKVVFIVNQFLENNYFMKKMKLTQSPYQDTTHNFNCAVLPFILFFCALHALSCKYFKIYFDFYSCLCYQLCTFLFLIIYFSFFHLRCDKRRPQGFIGLLTLLDHLLQVSVLILSRPHC